MVDKVSYNPSFGASTSASRLMNGKMTRQVIKNTPIEYDAQIADLFENELKVVTGSFKPVEVETAKIPGIMKWIKENLKEVVWYSTVDKGLIGKPTKKVLSVARNDKMSTYRISDVLADNEEGATVTITVPAQTVNSVLLAKQAKATPITKPTPTVARK